MLKSELKEYLLAHGGYSEADLKGMKKDEMEEIYEEMTDDSNMFPNGRDYDAEDW